MTQTLLIVESPTKAKAIGGFLGSGYRVIASMGHVRDLPEKEFGVDVKNGFTPTYDIMKGKNTTVKTICDAAKNAPCVLLASDPDREGEAISWHLAILLGIDPSSACRVTFHEITSRTVLNAVRKPRSIDMGLVEAQTARRVLDRIVGYEASPILCRKIGGRLSAGRVQSAALKIICDREAEIEAFEKEEYWILTALLRDERTDVSFPTVFSGENGKKRKLRSSDEADEVMEKVNGIPFICTEMETKPKSVHPAPPFKTSTLQQEASRKLGYDAKKTMKLAQELFEGIDLGKGTMGLITYHRTDSVRVANEAQQAALSLIEKHFGKEYLPDKPNFYRSGANAQDGHEAIRPTDLSLTPSLAAKSLRSDQLRLYRLIYERFVASQMRSAELNVTNSVFNANGEEFRASGSVTVFPGFIKVYTEGKDTAEKEGGVLPPMQVGDRFACEKMLKEQHFTEPPSRFTDASIIKTLEEKGIGRPSTYASIISVIIDRGYVERVKKSLIPTTLGKTVNTFMTVHFPHIVDTAFTAEMEKSLDAVENGEADRLNVLTSFYGPFHESVQSAAAAEKQTIPAELSDTPCPSCGAMMVIKSGKYGKFLACPNYPACKTTVPIRTREETGVHCPKCGGMILKKKGKKKAFYGCENYPGCDFALWDRPISAPCPACGAIQVRKCFKRKFYISCTNPDCPKKNKTKKED